MQIRFSTDPFSELEFSGSATDFSELAQALFYGDGEITADNGANPKPYNGFGSRIVIKTISGTKARVAINQQEVVISGDIEWLNVFARNMESLGKGAKPPYHSHIEFFEDHPYLAPGSFPLVCSLEC